MNTTFSSQSHFDQPYQTPLKHLKLKGLQPKTIEAYSRTLRRIGARFDHQIDSLTEAQLRDYFTELVASHAWSVTGCSSSLCIAWGCAWAKGYGCNRHCPHCPHHESQPWLERQLQKQVPAEYVLLTFTLPAEFKGLALAHQRIIYDSLIRCSWVTVRAFAQNDKQLRGTPGAIAVLDTNTRQMEYHPHVHLVMPAAVVAREQQQ
ncbi:hypothetical protein NTGBS_650008 [Candidatus Nitrotoga sp. BS]|uniref:IS91 family transposase n=1 Tax=Candidatus Nitrotoga sp. BS TaxID=2890408 RepID=UPI001EF2AEA3|nr:transposase zinc-binding domain-containing protein [Candidatus Nitrotoga sp. BS]CAH1206541.1 hypothetical protein NTGBS_650008 [Candidatus Nitrotoga sp. BS]